MRWFALCLVFAVGSIVGYGVHEYVPRPQKVSATTHPIPSTRKTHRIDHLVFRCIDYRFRCTVDAWVRTELGDEADLVAWPGVSSGFTDPLLRPQMLKTITLAHELHGITTVHLINHMDCGGHGGSKKHADNVAEHRYHETQLRQAADTIVTVFPQLTVRIYVTDTDGVHELK